MKNTRGITLIALIITIIIMITLVGVTIATVINGGLFGFAKKATDKTKQEAAREEIQSILPFYYLESDKLTLEEFLTAKLIDDITVFANSYENAEYRAQLKGYTFNYKGFGFYVDKDSLVLTSLDNPVKIFEQITNTEDLEIGQEYLIASGVNDINTEGNTFEISYVLDEQNNAENGAINRKNKPFETISNTIIYSGEYALTLGGTSGSYTFYDSKNKKYLNETSNIDNCLGLGNNDEYAKCSINFTRESAQIEFKQKDTGHNIVRNSQWYTSCYDLGKGNDVYLYKYVGTVAPDRLETPQVQATSDDKKIILTWNTVEGATSYTVSWKDESGNQTTEVVTICEFAKENLNNGSVYYYQVRANSTNPDKVNSSWTEETIAIPTTGTYELVTNDSMLQANSTYLIATSSVAGTAYTIGMQNGNYREQTEVNIEDNGTKIISYNNNYYPLRLERSSGNWKFKDLKNNGYLIGGNKIFRVDTTGTQNFTATIDATSYIASIQYENYYLKYNSSSPRFTCYGSGQNDIYLYKETGESVLPTPVVKAGAINGTATLEWGMATGATYYLVWDGTERTTPVTSPYTISSLSNGTEYTYQIKAVKGEEVKYSEEGTIIPIATKTYELVTNISDLTSGESYLIVNSKAAGTAYTMGGLKSNNMDKKEVKILTNGTIEYPQSSFNYTLEKDTANNAWKIYETVNGTYLYTPYDSNTLKAGGPDEILTDDTTITDIDLFNINFGTDGMAIMSGFCPTLQGRCIQFNNSASVFSFYKFDSAAVTFTQKPVYLFKCID